MSCHCGSVTLRSRPVPNVSNLLSAEKKYNLSAKAKERNAIHTGHLRHPRIVYCRFKHKFPEETIPKSHRVAVAVSSLSYGMDD